MSRIIGLSSNGRTADSDSANRGSNPCRPAKHPSDLNWIWDSQFDVVIKLCIGSTPMLKIGDGN